MHYVSVFLNAIHTSSFLWYFNSALPCTCLISFPLAVWGGLMEWRGCGQMGPALLFVLLLSLLPHQELRLIVYVFPIINVVAGVGLPTCEWGLTHIRAHTCTHRHAHTAHKHSHTHAPTHSFCPPPSSFLKTEGLKLKSAEMLSFHCSPVWTTPTDSEHAQCTCSHCNAFGGMKGLDL